MANTLKFGNGLWATKEGSTLAYNDENGNYKPLPFEFERDTNATVVNKNGLIETVGNNIPRIDFQGNNKGALLLEPERTNSLLQSNQFDTTWSNLGLTTVGGQIGVGGSNDAWLLNVNSNSGSIRQNVTQNGEQSLSLYAKKGSVNWIALYVSSTVDPPYVYFDLENGVVGTSIGGNTIDENIESVGNGWYRCSIVFDRTITSDTIRIFPSENDNILGNIGDSIYIQYAQLEQGSYPTSYIPTSGGTVTRAGDDCVNAGNDQVINSTEGVLYFEGSALASDSINKQMSLNDGGQNTLRLIYNANNIRAFVQVSAVTVVDITHALTNAENVIKVALKYKINDYALWVNGAKVGVNTTAPIFSANSLDKFSFNDVAASNFYSKTKNVKVYNTALTDAELQALTS